MIKNLGAAARFVFIVVNNLYCIPAHIVWMILLWPLRMLHPPLWLAVESLSYEWLLTMVAIWCYTGGYHVIEAGDDVSLLSGKEALFMYNHQSTADVPLIMATMTSKPGITQSMMWIMDILFKWTNFGWVSQIHKDFFIVSGKQAREDAIARLKCHLVDTYVTLHRKWIVLFPEGGFLRKRKPIAQGFAKKNGLPHLEHVTLPRVGALQTILATLNTPKNVEDKNLNLKASEDRRDHLKYIVDVTVAYRDGKPLDCFDIFFQKSPPTDTIFYYRVYPVSKLPETNAEIGNWMYDRYVEKDKMLETYYRTGVFPAVDHTQWKKMVSRKIPQDYTYFTLLHLFFIASSCFQYWLFRSALRFMIGW